MFCHEFELLSEFWLENIGVNVAEVSEFVWHLDYLQDEPDGCDSDGYSSEGVCVHQPISGDIHKDLVVG